LNRRISDPSKQQKRKIIGLHSGISRTGTDVVLLEIPGTGCTSEFEVLYTYHHLFSSRQKQFLRSVCDLQHSDITSISQANLYLAGIWAGAIQEMLARCKEKAGSIDLIGIQELTIHNQSPAVNSRDDEVNPILQIGDPAVLAQLTGITTVGDFHLTGLAAAGPGIRLETYLDWLVFSKLKKAFLILNIGECTNCTYIPADGDKLKLVAFDTGPGNRLIDQFMQRLYDVPFDRDGIIASLGSFSEKLFNHVQKMDRFPGQPPPKYLNQEQYGPDFILMVLRQALRWRIPEPDVIHTICRYLVFTTWKAFHDFILQDVQEVVIGGSGSQNLFIMQLYQEYFPFVSLRKFGDYNLPQDFKEAICSAILANEFMKGAPADLTELNGTRKPMVSGKIYH
jgi:anhydro-N-acetylmuramic acid kinase